MKKIGAFLVVFLLVFSLSFAFAATDNSSDSSDSSSTTDTTDTTTSTTDTSADDDSDSVGTLGDINKAYQCLEEKAGDSCEKLSSVQDLAFTILSTPHNIMDACVAKLEAKKKTDNSYGSIRETALAVLALDHAGKNTDGAQAWLESKKTNPTDIIWFLQQDSEGETECKFDYGGATYDVVIDENKKISANSGNCLTRAQSNFWYEIESSCYTETFKVNCNQDFITSLLYKSRLSSTIFVLEDTQTSPAFGTTEHKINSKCLGTSGSCDFEGTAWGAFALQVTGNDVDEYIPYLISTADLKKQYLPNAFIYLLTGYDEYGTRLIQQQKFSSYWEADNTAHNRFYDTSLTLISLGISQEQTTTARDWLLFEQGSNGCWANNARDTAIVLWATQQRDYAVEPTTVYCDEAGFYCVENSQCSSANDIGNNYYCSGTTRTCCKEKETQSCFDLGGTVCAGDQACLGFETEATDTQFCCLAGCGELAPQTTECEDNYYSCFDSCSEDYESAGYSCNVGQVCCKPKPVEESSSGGLWWLWLLLILIILVIIAIIIVRRRKGGAKKGDEGSEAQGAAPGQMPPGGPGGRPGMNRRPPMRRGPGGRPMPGPGGRPPMRRGPRPGMRPGPGSRPPQPTP